MKDFYNPLITLRNKLKDGNYPLIIYNVSAGRGPGKTTGWTHLIMDYVFDMCTFKGFEDEERKVLDTFFADGGKFILFTRNKNSVNTSVFEGVFKGAIEMYYPHITKMYEVRAVDGVFSKCYVEYEEDGLDEDGGAHKNTVKRHVGYVVALRADDDIKRYSPMFHDVGIMFMDEFQPDNNETYLTHEAKRFVRIYKSVARGGKAERNEDGSVDTTKSIRRVPAVFVSNAISIENPYFVMAEIWNKIQSNTMKYINGTTLFHRVENPDIEKAYSDAIDAAFPGLVESSENASNAWFNDDYACVQSSMKGCGESMYECTLVAGNALYGVRYYPEIETYYVDSHYDKDFIVKLNLYTEEMKPNIPAFRKSVKMKKLSKAAHDGRVLFKSTLIKNECAPIFLGGNK